MVRKWYLSDGSHKIVGPYDTREEAVHVRDTLESSLGVMPADVEECPVRGGQGRSSTDTMRDASLLTIGAMIGIALVIVISFCARL